MLLGDEVTDSASGAAARRAGRGDAPRQAKGLLAGKVYHALRFLYSTPTALSILPNILSRFPLSPGFPFFNLGLVP